MGYYMDQSETYFTIKKENKDKALDLLKQFAAEHTGEYWSYPACVLETHTLGEAFEECGWEVMEDDDGNIKHIRFVYEKAGDEYNIFSAVAPAVENGSFIEMHGEDTTIWRWVFKDGKCKEEYPKIIWDYD